MSNITPALRAGAAQTDITPAKGIQLAGDIGRDRPMEEVRDPIYAKALVLESGKKRVCWLTLDLLAIIRPWGDKLRRQAAERYGFDADAVMVHILQNHAAPSLGHFFVVDESDPNPLLKKYPWLLGGDDRYHQFCLDGALKAIGEAVAVMQPVKFAVGRGVDGRMAFNRRFVMRDGSAQCHPRRCDPNILHVEGPVDPEVGVMTFTALDGKPVATVLHHTCHPVHGYPERWVTAGWPGAWCNGVKELVGGGVAIVLNGFCGNIHHANHLDPAQSDDTYSNMGRKLTETTATVLKRMTPVEQPLLDWQAQWLKIPLRRLTEKELADAQRLIREHPEPIWKDESKTAVDWGWVYAACRLDLAKLIERQPLSEYFIQAFRLGNVGVVAAAGEPYVEEQLRVKLNSPVPFTFMAHMSNHYVGYLPTPEALRKDSFETRTSIGSRLVPEALRTVGDALLALLKKLFPA